MSDSVVRNNSAAHGGGIYLDRAVAPGHTITDSVVMGNTATEAGGGIYSVSSESVLITGSTVSGNSAQSGGGIFLPDVQHLGIGAVIADSMVTDDVAAYGGGIWSDRPATLTDSAVTGNTATAAGGGIYGTGVVTLNGTSTLCGNVPDDWPGCSP